MKRWKPPNDPTVPARQLWGHLYGLPWPRGWKVVWHRGRRNPEGKELETYGLADFAAKRIWLSFRAGSERCNIVTVLIHEFVHVRNPKLRHGKRFDRQVENRAKELGIQGTLEVFYEREVYDKDRDGSDHDHEPPAKTGPRPEEPELH